jgi:hypothetical protein
MPSDVVSLTVANAEALKQRLDALVAAAVRRHILAARQLLDEEHAVATDHEW